MKAVCFIEKGVVDVLDMPMPEPKYPGDILVKVDYCAICGDDRRIVEGTMAGGVVRPPYIIGHEMSGTIVSIGKEAEWKGFAEGDRVTGNFTYYCGECHYCNTGKKQLCEYADYRTHAMAEYVVWNEQQLYRLPENVSLKEACLTEPLTSCLRAVGESRITFGSRVAIFGAGGIGLMLLQLVRMQGAAQIVVIEPNSVKRDIAIMLGADHVIDPNEENIYKKVALLTEARGFDTVIEASGNNRAVSHAFAVTGRGGELIIFSIHDRDVALNVNLTSFYMKDAVIKSIFTAPYHFEQALATIPHLNMEPLVKNVFSYTNVKKAFDREITRNLPRVIISMTE